uniref:Uncharacterized protein n=1 Tax=Micrurus lemniscatus lemniscatus TaxID=129467 RepID=A0A2D4JPB3_MICLE
MIEKIYIYRECDSDTRVKYHSQNLNGVQKKKLDNVIKAQYPKEGAWCRRLLHVAHSATRRYFRLNLHFLRRAKAISSAIPEHSFKFSSQSLQRAIANPSRAFITCKGTINKRCQYCS